MTEQEIRMRYGDITRALIRKNMTVSTMESCTAGLIASLLTDTQGASAILKGAFVTYSNEAKVAQGVPQTVIDTYGVYSLQTAAAMAKACRAAYRADVGIGITGIFGNPDPNNPEGTPGEVYFAIETDETLAQKKVTLPPQPDRYGYKLAAAAAVAETLLTLI